jgi:hypothetical protein
VGLIDRIRYYDGEFLRAFDFSDEQTYHMEMRRRLNRYLHLYGIVEGLNLAGDSEAGVTQVSIMPGLAIDALGREIYVFVPYTLGDSDITTNRITQGGTYDVWLRYQKTASTPPSSGYSNCNQANQYTRWVESFSVVLLQSPSHPFTYPGFSVDDTDDPSQDKVGVLLGTVVISLTSATGTFSGQLFDPNRCKLLGVIAQRIQTPPCSDTAGVSSSIAPFNFWNQPSGGLNTPLSPPASLEIKPNIFADQNLIVGGDFSLAQTPSGTTITPTPAFTTGPGSAKLAGDLIVQGHIYSFVANPTKPQWLGLSQYIQQLVTAAAPDVLTDSEVVTFPSTMPTSGNVSSFTNSKTLTTSRLTSIGTVVPIAFVLSSTLDTTIPTPGNPVVLSINSSSFAILNNTQCTVTANWTAGPCSSSGNCAITTFTIFFIAVCFPPSS